MAVILVQHLVTKTYILLVNVHGTYSTDVLKLVNQLVLIGQMQNIGQVMQQQMVIQHNATVGSIMQTTTGYYGHVAYVERVNADGSILISEMNYANGPYNTNTRTIPASVVSSYNFIH